MNANLFRLWLGQSTTGFGTTGICTTIAAVATGQMSLQAAIPALIGAALLILWPQNTKLAAAAQATVTDIETLIPPLVAAYRTGLQHGAAAAPVPNAAPAPQPAPLFPQ